MPDFLSSICIKGQVKSCLFTLFFVSLALISFGQKIGTFQQSFGGTSDDIGNSSLLLPDKGFILAGITKSYGSGGQDILLVRTDSVGKKIWSKTYGGTSDEGVNTPIFSSAVDVILSSDSNIIVCSNTKSYGAGGADVYLLKIDLNGNVKWSKTYGGTSNDVGMNIINDPNGGYLIVGQTRSYGGNGDVLVMKTDTGGNLSWAKAYGSSSLEEGGFRIAIAKDGNFLVCGYSLSSSTQYDQMLMKIDKNGKLLFSKVFGTSYYDALESVVDLPDSSIYVTGYTYNVFASLNTMATLSKFDKAGKFIWCKVYDKTQHSSLGTCYYESKNKVLTSKFVVIQNGQQRLGVMRFDTSGKMIFAKTYGPSSTTSNYTNGNECHVFISLPNGGYAMNYATNVFGYGGWDYFFTKLDTAANPNSCNVSTLSLSPYVFTSYISDYSYAFTTTTASFSGGTGTKTTSPTIKDTLVCSPFVSGFGFKNLCFGQTTQFTDSSYSKPTSWKWNFGDASSSSNTSTSQNPTHTFSKSGTYKVQLVSSNGTVKDSITKTITIIAAPTHTSTATKTICLGDSLNLKATGGGTYLWNNGAYLSDTTIASPWAFPYQTTTFIVSVTNSSGCSTLDTFIVKVDTSTSTCKTTKIGGIINTYGSVLGIDSCYWKLTIDTASGFKVGDKILIIQNQGAVIDSSNTSSFGSIKNMNGAGNYEYAHIDSISGKLIYLKNPLKNYYNVSGSVQIVTVPQYGNIFITSKLTSKPWNGKKGGILVFESTGSVALAANIDVSGLGFRGGAVANNTGACHASNYYYSSSSSGGNTKGEGIANPSKNYPRGRGANANGGGGGNDVDAGGGGGSNYGVGGLGGKEWTNSCSSPIANGGVGGITLGSNASGKLFLGGGGGSGSNYDTYATGGAKGGGIILIKAQKFYPGSYSVSANGGTVSSSSIYDGGGGGGGGGSIGLTAVYVFGKLKISAVGGTGGSTSSIYCTGPGGGGGGGAIYYNQSKPPVNSINTLSGGSSGLNTNGSSPCAKTAYGADSGRVGGVLTNFTITDNSAAFKRPYAKVSTLAKTICVGDSVQLIASVNGLKSVSWSPAATVRNPASANSYAFPTVKTTYKLTATTNGGCIIYDSVIIDVFPAKPPVPVINRVTDYFVSPDVWKSNSRLMFTESKTRNISYITEYISVDGGSYTKVAKKLYTGNASDTFINSGLNTNKHKYRYILIATDSCGHNSDTSVVNSPVLLRGNVGNLKSYLHFDNYVGLAIDYVQVWRLEVLPTATSWSVVGTLKATDTIFTDSTNLKCGYLYSYATLTYFKSGLWSFSDSVNLSPFDTISPAQVGFIGASVTNGNNIAIQFSKVSKATTRKYLIYRSKNHGTYSLIDSVLAKNISGTTYTYNYSVSTLSDTFAFEIFAMDSCGNLSMTKQVHQAIHLSGKALDDSSKLTWSSYLGFSVKNYTIQTRTKKATWSDTYTGILSSVNSFIAPGSCNDSFYFRVKAIQNGGNNAIVYSDSVMVMPFDTIPPAKDSMLSVSVIDGSHILVSFNKVSAVDASGYYIYRSKNHGTFSKIATLNKPSTSPVTYNDNINALTDTFRYQVYAFDSCGNTSKTAQTHRTIQLNGSPLQDSSKLSWSKYRGFNVKNYIIQSWTSGIGWKDRIILGSTDSIYKNKGYCPKTEYFRIKAVENGGLNTIVYSDSISIQPIDTISPAQVLSISTSVLDSAHIKVIFNTVSDPDVAGYYVYEAINKGAYKKVGTINSPTSSPVSFIDKINTLTDTLSYKIYAFDSCSNVSKNASVIQRAIQLNGKALDDSSLLSWSPYLGFTVKNYVLQTWSKTGGWGDTYTGISAAATSYKAPGSCNVRYYFRVKAIENGGNNSIVYSDSNSVVPFDTISPLKPVIQNITVTGTSSIQVNWTKSTSNDVKNYNVYRQNASGTWVKIASLGNVNTDTDNSVTTTNSYCYAVQAQDSCASNLSPLSPPHCSMVLQVSQKGCDRVNYLSWNKYSGWTTLKNYQIYRTVNAGAEALLNTISGSTTSYNDTGLSFHNTYCYRIVALDNSSSNSSSSNTACGKVFFVDTAKILTATKIVTSLTNGTVVIRWKSINKPHLSYHNLFYSANGTTFTLIKGNIPATQDTFTHSGINTETANTSYYLVTVDSCGTSSEKSHIHKTMDLTVSVGQLLHKLNWTSYKGFTIKKYYIQKLAGSFKTIDSVPATDTFTHYFPAPCNSVERYRIVAAGYNIGEIAWSDTMGRQAIDSQPSNRAIISNATVINGTTTKINFRGSDSLDTYDYVIQRSVDGVWNTAGSILFNGAGKQLTFTDNAVNTQKNHLCYTVITRDSCLNATRTDTFCVIDLRGKPQNLADSLHWNAFKGYIIGKYDILTYRAPNKWDTLTGLTGKDTQYLHAPLACNVPVTYKIMAFEKGGLRTTLSDSITLVPFDTIKPPAPTIQYASVLNGSQIKLFWNKSISKVKLYELSMKTGNGTWKVITTLTNALQYTFNGLNTTDSVYDFRLVAIDSCSSNRSPNSIFHSPVQLRGLGQNLSNQFTWKAYEGFPSVNKYYIYQWKNTWKLIDSVSGSTLSYLHKGLPCNVPQYYRIGALDNSRKYLSQSDTIQLTPFDTIKPPAPTIQYATVLNGSQIKLYWNKSIPKVKLYELSMKTGNGQWKLIATLTNTYQYTFTGLKTTDSVYDFRIVAIDSCAANRSPNSIFHSPVQLSGQGQNLSNLLTWKAYEGFSSVNKYYIYQWKNTWKLIDSVSGSTLTYLQKSLPCNVPQYYRIGALDNSGQYLSQSDTIQLTPYDTIKPPPSTIQYATVLNSSQIKLYWNKSIPKVKLYELSIKSGHGAWTVISPLVSGTSYVFNGLKTMDSVYDFRIVAIDSCAANRSSNSLFHSPVQLDGTQLDDTIKLSWKAYEGFSSVSKYYIYRYLGGWKILDSVAGNVTTYYDKPLPCNITQYYRIGALDNTGKYLSFSDTIKLTPFDTIKPPAPLLYAASVVSDNTIKLAWHWNTKSDVKYFDIYRSKNGSALSKIYTVIYDSVFTDIGVSPKKDKYAYQVIAIDSCNVSNRSLPSQTDTIMNISLYSFACTPQIKVSWTPYTGLPNKPDFYELYRSSGGNPFTKIASLKAPAYKYTDNTVSSGITYFYKISAVDSKSGYSSFSDSLGLLPRFVPHPDTSKIVYTSVLKTGQTNGQILINWQRANPVDTNVKGYHIYVYDSASKTYSLLYDEHIVNTTSHIHNGINTQYKSYNYYVIAYNSCIIEGEPSATHQPVLLKIRNQNLKAAIQWSKYQGTNVLGYDLYKAADGGVPYILKSFIKSDTAYLDTNIACRHTYFYQITARLANGSKSLSDSVGIQSFDTIPPVKTGILVATVLTTSRTTGQVQLSFEGNNVKNRSGYNIYRAGAKGSFVLVQHITDTTHGLIKWTDLTGLNTVDSAWRFLVKATDSCNNEAMPKDTHQVIHAFSKAYDKYITLGWTAYKGFKSWKYEVMKRDGNGNYYIFKILDSNTFNLVDSNVYCHRIYHYLVNALDGLGGYISFSNETRDSAINTDPPVTKPIQLATVKQTGITKGINYVSWNPSPSKNIEGYNIFRSIDGKIWKQVAIDYTGVSFSDTGLNTHGQPYYYKIQPVDSCGNLGQFTIIHKTINLKATAGNQLVALKWNGYQGWKVKKYLVYKNGTLVAAFGKDTLKWTDTLVLCSKVYTYQIKAVCDTTTDTLIVASNTDSVRAYDHIAPQPVYLKVVSVSTPNRAATITWAPSTSFDVKNYYIFLKSGKDGSFKFIDSTDQTSYIDSLSAIRDINKISGYDICYYVFARDHCGNQSSGSNNGCVIILNGKNYAGYNELNWNGYKKWYDGVGNYNVYKNEDGQGWNLIGTTGSGTITKYLDKNLGDTTINFCYQVEAVENQGKYNELSRSTVYCLHQDATVFIPNTFSHYLIDGLNDKFGPKGLHIKNYTMQVYNRWGEMVYKTDKSEDWDGTFKGQDVQEGVYIYRITVEDYNHNFNQFSGNITIFR